MRHGAPFTEAEDKYLQKFYLEENCATLAHMLSRSVSSTQSRLRHLGLSKRKAKKQAAGESVTPHQTRVTVLFDDDLVGPLRDQAKDVGRSMSAHVNEIVRKTIQKAHRAA